MSDTRDWWYSNGATIPEGGHNHHAPGNISRSWEWPRHWHASFEHERGWLPHTHENVYKPEQGLIVFTDGASS